MTATKRVCHACLIACATVAAFLAAPRALALDLTPGEIRGKSSKEPVTVLQNRYFLKAYRPEFGLVAGAVLDEAYTNTTTFGGRFGVFLNEWLAIEAQEMKTRVADSDDRKALRGKKYRPLDSESGDAVPSGTDTEEIVTPDAEVNALHRMTDVSVLVAPAYGKLNILGMWIAYTDVYLSAGYTRVETDQGVRNGACFSIGERLYIAKNYSLRVDIKDRIFEEKRAGLVSKKNSYGVDLGASYFFN